MVLICAATTVSAQGHHGKKDEKMFKEIEEYKMKYLAQEIELKEDQKEKFIEVYTKLSNERRANFEKIRQLEHSLKGNPSEADYKKAAEGMADARMRDAQLEKEYDAKFSEFLTQKQIYKLKEAEEQFRRKMHDMRMKRCGDKKKK